MVKFLQTLLILFLLQFTVFAQHAQNSNSLPGSVIAHSSSRTGKYIGSPSILILPNGDYLASHDFFGRSLKTGIVNVYKSSDGGESWTKISELQEQFWSTLFLVNNAVYIIGTTKEYGSVIIRKSEDWGKTWTTPTNKSNGIILNDREYHTAPVPVVFHKGRIWRSMEDRNPPTDWGKYFRTFVISAPVNSDLLNAENWETTNRLCYNQKWPGSAWLEGNVVETPQGYLWNILRNHTEKGGRAAITKVGLTGKVLTFDPEEGFIDFPGGSVKFTIRYDEVSEKYYSLTNYIPDKFKDGNPERTRNTVALISSNNLTKWKVEKIILQSDDVNSVGFQYIDFQFEGDDIIFLSRTAYYEEDGTKTSQHDSNYLTFHRIKNFRNLSF